MISGKGAVVISVLISSTNVEDLPEEVQVLPIDIPCFLNCV